MGEIKKAKFLSERINLYTLIHDLSDQYDYIALGDTNHRDETVRDLRGDLDLFRAVRDAGYEAFTLEKPPSDMLMNEIIDAQLEASPEANPAEYFEDLVSRGSDPVSLVGAYAAPGFEKPANSTDPR